MATTQDSVLKFSIAGLLQSIRDLSTSEDRFSFSYKKHLQTGSGADQADQFYQDSGECAGATDVFDLAGALTNNFGEAISLTKLKALIIKATPTIEGHLKRAQDVVGKLNGATTAPAGGDTSKKKP